MATKHWPPDSRFLQAPVSLVLRCCRQLHFSEVLITGQCCSSFWIFKSSFPFKVNLPFNILVQGSSVLCIWASRCPVIAAEDNVAEDNGHYPDSKSGKNVHF